MGELDELLREVAAGNTRNEGTSLVGEAIDQVRFLCEHVMHGPFPTRLLQSWPRLRRRSVVVADLGTQYR